MHHCWPTLVQSRQCTGQGEGQGLHAASLPSSSAISVLGKARVRPSMTVVRTNLSNSVISVLVKARVRTSMTVVNTYLCPISTYQLMCPRYASMMSTMLLASPTRSSAQPSRVLVFQK